ncbi:hypothetical protein H5410_055472 [Solanum commersonii]|uniref:Uncharacterized protein n=1 Tax=Solanum commersonii TaxID=4109 RepID=A0A9J5WIE3_SOLCO|nr:hypothetical protein H5410_055472 [Solanum commersonii]
MAQHLKAAIPAIKTTWELNDLLQLLILLESCAVNVQTIDRMKWGNSNNGLYSVKAGYNNFSFDNPMIDKWPWIFGRPSA